MPDINKLIAMENMSAFEAGEYLNDMEDWNEGKARELARAEALALTDEHMEVICWLRDFYAECGPPAHGRALAQAMEDAFAEQGGRKYLYRLFPNGPVAQSCRLAGLKAPPYTVDRSFGSVH